jgi:hypothetical protein
METATLTINRYEENGNTIHSHIIYKHQNTICHFQGIERKGYEIPQGEFMANYNHSPKFNTKLYNINIPNRQGIRIHWGNSYKDVIGCVIVGLYRKDETILNSKYMVNTLHHISKGKQLKIIITWQKQKTDYLIKFSLKQLKDLLQRWLIGWRKDSILT